MGKSENNSSGNCNRTILEAFGDISNKYIQTNTFDNGSEFAQYKNLEDAL